MMPDSHHRVLTGNLERVGAPPGLESKIEQSETSNVALDLSNLKIPRLTVGGRDLCHAETPVEQAAREVAGFLADKNPDVVVFFGLGLGLHARFLELQTDAPIIIYEPRIDVLAQVLPRIKLELERAILITNPGHLVEVTVKHLSASRQNLVAGAIPTYRDVFPEDFQSFSNAMNLALKRIQIDQNTKALFAEDWVDHLRANLPTLVQSPALAALEPAFENRPGILVGAGPSLDDNIEVLRNAQGQALICAVHTAMMPLARVDIVPQIVTMIEGHNLDYFFADLPNLEQTYLALDLQTHPRHLELGFKGFLPLNPEGRTSSDWLQRSHGYEPMPAGGSVACSAFSLLHHLGCNPIILVGMDTAFTHGRTHSLHSDSGCCRVKLDPESGAIAYTFLDGRLEDGHWDAMEVEAWGGQGSVMTRPVYSSFRTWFEAAGNTWAADRTIINATEGGARFQGFEELSLADTLDRFARGPLDAFGLLDEAVQGAPPMGRRPLGQALQEELDSIGKAAEAALQVIETGKLVLKFLKSGQLNKVQPFMDNLARSEESLQSLTRETRLLNSLIGHKVMEYSRQTAPVSDQVSQTIHSVELSLKISRLVARGARDLESKFRPLINEFLRETEADSDACSGRQ